MKNLFRKLRLKYKKGFTLVEVLVVLVILVTLTAIAVPTYRKIIDRSRVSDGMHVLDMLADAQEKYFVEHQRYANRLSKLRVPIKNLVEGDNDDDLIRTTNFEYSKIFSDDCIRAKSQHSDYVLVKNYNDRSKINCIGEGCEKISDYVKIAESFGGVCPTVHDCDTEQEDCDGLHFWPDPCKCHCDQSAYEDCVARNGTFTSDCQCNISDGPTPPEPPTPPEDPEPCEGVQQLTSGDTDANGNTDVILCTDNNDGKELCGTKTATGQTCENGHWVWDFTGADCNGEEKPASEQILSPEGCFYKETQYNCELGEDNQPQWVQVASEDSQWLPVQSYYNCEEGIMEPQDDNTLLCHQCRVKRCRSGSVLNTHNLNGKHKRCLVHLSVGYTYTARVHNSIGACAAPTYNISPGPNDTALLRVCAEGTLLPCEAPGEVRCSSLANPNGNPNPRKVWMRATNDGSATFNQYYNQYHNYTDTWQKWCASPYALEYALVNDIAPNGNQLASWVNGTTGGNSCESGCSSVRIRDSSNVWTCYEHAGSYETLYNYTYPESN